MKRVALIGCLVLLLGAIVVLLAKRLGFATGRSEPRDASLICLGVTKLPKGSFAIFCLSNSTGQDVACVPEAFEERNAGGWVRMPLTRGARGGVRDWIGVPEELRSGQGTSFLVPEPTTNSTWRLVFMCQERARLMDAVTDTARHFLDTNAAQVRERQFSGRRYYISSPEVVP